MDQLRVTMLVWSASMKDALHPRGDAEHGDVSGWAPITLMAAALVVLVWGVVSQRLMKIFNHAMDPPSPI